MLAGMGVRSKQYEPYDFNRRGDGGGDGEGQEGWRGYGIMRYVKGYRMRY
jgi:hypothetical protein